MRENWSHYPIQQGTSWHKSLPADPLELVTGTSFNAHHVTDDANILFRIWLVWFRPGYFIINMIILS